MAEDVKDPIYNRDGQKTSVDEFCRVCDFYDKCPIRMNDRERYVRRDWCGWGQIDGIKATISLEDIGTFDVRKGKISREEDREKLVRFLRGSGSE